MVITCDKFNISQVITITTSDIFQYFLPAIVYYPNNPIIPSMHSLGSTNQLTLLQFLLQWHIPFVYILPE